MKFYQDITILPDIETSTGFILQKIYSQLHLTLVEMKTENGNSNVAVSFPDYANTSFPPGNKLRLFSTDKAQLQKLDISRCLSRLSDYMHCTSIKEVPLRIDKHALFKRVQFDTSLERLARRRSRRKNESYEQAIKHFHGFKEQESELPYINVRSLSNDKRFRLFIRQEIVDEESQGEFNCYGLSKTATVPWFE